MDSLCRKRRRRCCSDAARRRQELLLRGCLRLPAIAAGVGIASELWQMPLSGRCDHCRRGHSASQSCHRGAGERNRYLRQCGGDDGVDVRADAPQCLLALGGIEGDAREALERGGGVIAIWLLFPGLGRLPPAQLSASQDVCRCNYIGEVRPKVRINDWQLMYGHLLQRQGPALLRLHGLHPLRQLRPPWRLQRLGVLQVWVVSSGELGEAYAGESDQRNGNRHQNAANYDRPHARSLQHAGRRGNAGVAEARFPAGEPLPGSGSCGLDHPGRQQRLIPECVNVAASLRSSSSREQHRRFWSRYPRRHCCLRLGLRGSIRWLPAVSCIRRVGVVEVFACSVDLGGRRSCRIGAAIVLLVAPNAGREGEAVERTAGLRSCIQGI
mmetsp:Transcript_105187/g.224690  ORF Transcript_105187/g.224690 Transcript_105187/m.224690 type:complete len:383 (+) Transcript_105187:371-1519(+)